MTEVLSSLDTRGPNRPVDPKLLALTMSNSDPLMKAVLQKVVDNLTPWDRERYLMELKVQENLRKNDG